MFKSARRITLFLILASAALAVPAKAQALHGPRQIEATTLDERGIIINCQGYFKDAEGVTVYIARGIPNKWLQSQAEYHKMINAGVRHRFPGAERATIFTDANGSVVRRQIAVRDRVYRTWDWRKAPKPQDDALSDATPRCCDRVGPDDDATRHWGGKARCTISCADGSCKEIECRVGFEYRRKSDAKAALKTALEAKASLHDGTITGTIQFDIEIKF